MAFSIFTSILQKKGSRSTEYHCGKLLGDVKFWRFCLSVTAIRDVRFQKDRVGGRAIFCWSAGTDFPAMRQSFCPSSRQMLPKNSRKKAIGLIMMQK
ncbi:hypothetical protein [Haliscomenobacter hydrossis]|uniref:hypothetical protein n=1 Tax=Haliscomenobacter hydrossis TaxID=2350 RepID=UPI0011D26A58|nr:hypothetical protein [Haliscomenobacter hydrossis]